ncbi:MAG: helix-turn-helix domain-containing protein [Nitrospinales bacterium]
MFQFQLILGHFLSIQAICKTLDISRSTFYRFLTLARTEELI